MRQNHIKIISRRVENYSSKIELDGQTYLIESEDLGVASRSMITRIYYNGECISSYESDYSGILNSPDLGQKLVDMMKEQQRKAIERLRMDLDEQKKPYKEYIKQAELLIRKNKTKEALELLGQAKNSYPDNPVVSSYIGMLEVIHNKNHSAGISLCKNAVWTLRESMGPGSRFTLPIAYLNLGKAYLASYQKKHAFDAFKQGLKFDRKNRNLLAELRKLGTRRGLTVPFLDRSNPINVYLGRLRYLLKIR